MFLLSVSIAHSNCIQQGELLAKVKLILSLRQGTLYSELLRQHGGSIDHLSKQFEAVDDGGYRSVG